MINTQGNRKAKEVARAKVLSVKQPRRTYAGKKAKVLAVWRAEQVVGTINRTQLTSQDMSQPCWILYVL